MESNERNEMKIRSGAEARQMGKVPEYAEQMKKTLIETGQSEEEAEKTRLQIIERFGS